MVQEILMFGNIEIKHKFHHNKIPIYLEDVYIKNVLASKKISSGQKNYKQLISYLGDYYKIKSLHIMLPETSTYIKHYDGQTELMYFLIEDDDLLEKYSTIWDKVSAYIKKFNSESLFNKTFLKTKIVCYAD